MESKPVKKTKSNFPGPGPGRPAGVPNKMTGEVKQMILDALSGAGGVDYLIAKAESHPGPFLSLVGKVLPMQVEGSGKDGEFVVTVIERKIVDPKA